MTHSSLLNAPARANNDARNLFIITLPTLLGLLCLLGLILLEVTVSKAFLGSSETFWTQVIHGSDPSGLCPALTPID
ncbi:hypothetical protein PGN35_011760 [Nodosilinea sp. PGN35]|uniref:hypothetical protein n=1 Tax=Nodosilinea sp. PGN35 TaxID=3020489 RepID=UPI0023B2BCB4|nr:hypothetical protein [Nodosilinea sp. TSF1-S3]MDF0366293.1 hypothetical protein [Nodosilinea sp. TSF1-S3]